MKTVIELKLNSLRVLLMVIFPFVACNHKCEDFDEMPGFDELQGIEDVEAIDLSCIALDSISLAGVIQDDSIYQHITTSLLVGGIACESFQIPTIDFSTRTMLWNYSRAACSSEFKRLIIREGNTVTYTVKVYVDNFGCLNYDWNAVSIPKISETDTVVFKTVIYGCN